MTERERFIATLKREKIGGRVPTFELVFYLTMEAFGKVHPEHRSYHQWQQMSFAEQELHLEEMAGLYVDTAKRYHHSAIFLHPNPGDPESQLRLYEKVREISGEQYFLMMHGDPTFAMPNGSDMMDFSVRMYEDREGLKREAQKRVDDVIRHAEWLDRHGHLIDGFALCSDYCFNVNPFFTCEAFADYVAPYLKQAIDAYRAMGYYTIKHTDGNILPILDQMAECGPDAFHSLDPQAGVSLAEISRDYGDRFCLIGNVNCGLLQTGTDEECDADVRRSLRDGMARGAGYVFSTSNCAYTGLPLARYERMNRIWWEEGIYKETEARADSGEV